MAELGFFPEGMNVAFTPINQMALNIRPSSYFFNIKCLLCFTVAVLDILNFYLIQIVPVCYNPSANFICSDFLRAC